MDTLLRQFRDHPLVATIAGIVILVITVLPFTRSRFLRVFLRLGSTLLSVVVVPFSFWRRTLLDLASGTGMSLRPSSTVARRRAVPVLQSLLIVGGLLILTAGIVSGWHASGITRETGQLKSALRSELPELERTLADTRSKIAELDREWETSRACLVEESLTALSTEARALRDESVVLEDFLTKDRQTREVFRIVRDESPSALTGGGTRRDLRADLPALGLPREKEWLLARYLDNRAREKELTIAISRFDEADVRKANQPEVETLRRIESELPPAIARVREDLASPDPGRTFDVAAFAAASLPSLVLFCGFVWMMGGVIEGMDSGVPLRRRARAAVDETGHLKWVE